MSKTLNSFSNSLAVSATDSGGTMVPAMEGSGTRSSVFPEPYLHAPEDAWSGISHAIIDIYHLCIVNPMPGFDQSLFKFPKASFKRGVWAHHAIVRYKSKAEIKRRQAAP
ncbi:uncharacterized protein FFB14_01696 [Fusarium fujikuroi]|nr:uncharacterized protein FFB14_01696 [Fusarium fujikuroi]